MSFSKECSCSANIKPASKQKRSRDFIPEANAIFESLQHLKKSIYPFPIKSISSGEMSSEQEPYGKINKLMKFKPIFNSIQQHFTRNYLVYDKFNNNMDETLFNMNIYSIEKLKNLKNIDYIAQPEFTQPYTCNKNGCLLFDSRFESGNLSLASYIPEIDTYFLLLHNDVNTSGYTSWFYFSVKNQIEGLYKFAILNYSKAGWQHNQGVKICAKEKNQQWSRVGQNIFCERNTVLFKEGKLLNLNTLYFEYQFKRGKSEILFAYNPPYTYNDLCCYLDSIEFKKYPYFNRKLAGLSLAGNRLQMLRISNPSSNSQPTIVFTARSHPGQTVSSWVMHYIIQFLLSDHAQAKILRQNFVFKIFPMINPDGVIHGNYRCSLSGRDLNRRWKQPNKQLFPQIYNIKNKILEPCKQKNIRLIIDLHGHSQKKNFFTYGCQAISQPHKSRLYPFIVSKLTNLLQFNDCNFFLQKSKFGTARISLFRQLRIPYIYTIQTSQFGTVGGHHSLNTFREIAQSLIKSIKLIFAVKGQDNYSVKQEQSITSLTQQQASLQLNVQILEEQMLNNKALMKVGNEPDCGSDSEPSIDNIQLDTLKNLNNRKSIKINSNPGKPRTEKREVKFIRNHKSFEKRPQTSVKVTILDRKKRIQRPLTSSGIKNTIISKQARQTIAPYNRRQQPRCSVSLLARRGEGVNFINLSLSINDEKHSMKNRQRQISQVSSPWFSKNQIIRKFNITQRNLCIFRRFK